MRQLGVVLVPEGVMQPPVELLPKRQQQLAETLREETELHAVGDFETDEQLPVWGLLEASLHLNLEHAVLALEHVGVPLVHRLPFEHQQRETFKVLVVDGDWGNAVGRGLKGPSIVSEHECLQLPEWSLWSWLTTAANFLIYDTAIATVSRS